MSVALVGAGPGDPGLVTVRGAALIREADVILYDRLGAEALLPLARPGAELVDVGKKPGAHAMSQDEINRALVELARSGLRVVRLKGGDPFVYGRGGEEVAALAAAGFVAEVVPGITSAIAGPAAAGIPVTHRDLAASVAFAPGQSGEGTAGTRIDWNALASADTAVVLMGVRKLEGIAGDLIAAGKPASTPAALIQDATLPGQRTVVATIGSIAARARAVGIRAPAVLVVGEVAALATEGPLAGVRALVTRTREQASELSRVLRARGADVLEESAITVEPPVTTTEVDDAIKTLSDRAWVVFTSVNGVRAFAERLRAAGRDARAFGTAQVAAIGPGTASALRDLGIEADLVPQTFTTTGLADAFPPGRGRVLLARAEGVDLVLDHALQAKGWIVERVTTYRVVPVPEWPEQTRRAVLDGSIDVLTFASGGTVRAFLRLLDAPVPVGIKIVCIGPVTADAARAAGLRVDAVASPHTIDGLADAVAGVVGAGS